MRTSYFVYPVESVDSVYVFDVCAPGYKTKTVTWEVKNVGKREKGRQMPYIYLERAPRELKEVTVTASKIKFYNKGDTIVYNADAFQLAEGSMLDALIAQLPGAQLGDDGRITINGEFVESLLLNGKEFFKGNNQLMLENIGAYTVKHIEVYKGQSPEEKWRNDPMAPKHLTMDVKLKKEYSMGWMVNAQGGYGTKDRYMGRLFASWFNSTTSVTLLGNINNLNDNRKPGRNDTWTPEAMPSGTRRYKMAGINYYYRSRDDDKNINGHMTVEHTSADNRTTTARENFLNGGNTYDYSFRRGKSSRFRWDTRNFYGFKLDERLMFSGLLAGRFTKNKNDASSISASFNKEQADITYKALEALYSDGSPERLDAVINRSITRTNGTSYIGNYNFFPSLTYLVPGTNDRAFLELGIKWDHNKEHLWEDYDINFGKDPNPAERRRQYFDRSPNHQFTMIVNSGYSFRINDGLTLGLDYGYRFENHEKDSYMYALDRLADMGIYGTLPQGYLGTLDPANSYTSTQFVNSHYIEPQISWSESFKNGNRIYLIARPEFKLTHIHLDYMRDNRSYIVKRSSFLVNASNWRASAVYDMAHEEYNNRKNYKHTLQYNYTVDTKLPDPYQMIDVVNDADPLNIMVGNPDLKNAISQSHSLAWTYHPLKKALRNMMRVQYQYTDNAHVRGYVYDTSTGVRRNRTYNVDGNNSLSFNNSFNLTFGNKGQFLFASDTDVSRMNYADMIGVNSNEPEKSKALTRSIGENIKFTWQLGKQSISVNGSVTNRHTTSTREDFAAINANHFKYGLTGNFALPAGFGINTDFTCYTRRGYGLKELDTTDAVWNMRMTYTPSGKRWVFMLDGFDILHRLSNVNYAVNAAGRTVTYTNALPRYVLLSVQYRLNIQPKKRR